MESHQRKQEERLCAVENKLAALVDAVQALVAQSRGPKTIQDDFFDMPTLPIATFEGLDHINRKLLSQEYCDQIVIEKNFCWQ